MTLLGMEKIEKQFDSEEKCNAYLEAMRWPQGVRCPNCGNTKISHIQSKGKTGKPRRLYQCLEKTCRYQFSATTRTIFHDSHLPLSKWFTAMMLVSKAEDGISTNQLRHALGVQYKTAQHVGNRIREAMLQGTFEVGVPCRSADETPEILIPSDSMEVAPAKRSFSGITQFHYISDHGNVNQAMIVNMLNIMNSLAHITIRSPFFLANYIIRKVSLDT